MSTVPPTSKLVVMGVAGSGKSTLAARLAAVLSQGHLFPSSLVTSQFAALESPAGEPAVLSVPAQLPLQQQVESVRSWLVEGGVASGAAFNGSTV